MSGAGQPTSTTQPLLSTRLDITADGVVNVFVGKVELGQGILTAFAQIAAEELDVALDRVRVFAATTARGPDEGTTSGSRSVMFAGVALRQACAEARMRLLEAAASKANVPVDALCVRDGCVFDEHAELRATYWQFAGTGVLERPASGHAKPKPPGEHTIVGRAAARLDLPDKFAGRPRFIHDLSLPGQLFGRVVRPPAPGARLNALDDRAARSISTVVAVVREGSFLGVVATREDDAVRAAELLRRHASWTEPPPLPDQQAMAEHLKSQPVEHLPLARVVDESAQADVAKAIERSYRRPYVAHASIAPGCGVARWESDRRLTVWTHSQGIFPLRSAIAAACAMEEASVVVHHVEGAGCYGHNSADDAAFDAVLLARAVPGRPVQVVWSRDDEFAWEPYGSAMVVDLRVEVDHRGDIVRWRHDVWGGGHHARPGYAELPGLLGDFEANEAVMAPAEDPSFANGAGNGRNAVPAYRVRDLDVNAHRALTMPIRTSSLRALGATLNVFAIESAIDELAEAAGVDQVEYRVRQLPDERARAVVRAAADLADWAHRAAGESLGWGIAYARYKNSCAHCAVVACVEAVSELRVRQLFVAVDAGQVINPDGLANQIEGGATQAASWAVKEAVTFDRHAITSRDWESYPILRFTEAPTVTVRLLPLQHEPPLGVGECAAGPVTAAIANALHDAIGVRVRDLPLTPDRIEAAIRNA